MKPSSTSSSAFAAALKHSAAIGRQTKAGKESIGKKPPASKLPSKITGLRPAPSAKSTRPKKS